MKKTAIHKMIRGNRKINLSGICKLLIFAAVCQSFGSCVKDDLHNTPHPDKGAVRVTTDWTGRSEEAVQPENYLLRIGEESQEVTAETNTFKSLLAPGTYRLLAYNTPEGVSVTGNTATVDTKDDGTLTPQPGYLFSAGKELDVAADDTLKITLPMQQYIRCLTLTLQLAEGKPALAAMLRLMGVITSERQTLTLAVTLTDGSVQTIRTDLTEMLKDFGGTDRKPLTLDALLNLPTASSMGGTITGWTEVDNGDITIH